MEVKRDCFAYRNFGNGERCIALRDLYCKYEKCKFYKKVGSLCQDCTNKERGISCKNCRDARAGYY